VKLGRDWIYGARRNEIRKRLVDDERVASDRAEQLLADWEAEATRRREDPDSPNYWRDGARWIFGQLPHRDGHRAP